MAFPLPDKLYYKIGEISKALSLNQSVLRFWETEFSQLKPRKSSAGQRLYSKDDLVLLQTIRNLLYKDKLTIEGARRVLAGMTPPPPESHPPDREHQDELIVLLREIRTELQHCSHILRS